MGGLNGLKTIASANLTVKYDVWICKLVSFFNVFCLLMITEPIVDCKKLASKAPDPQKPKQRNASSEVIQ